MATKLMNPDIAENNVKLAKRIAKIQGDIDHHCNGPMTPFVAICRAIEISAENKENAVEISEALYNVLEAYEWLTDNTPYSPIK